MEDIALIAPINSIYEKAIKIKKERKLNNLEVYYGSLEKGVKLAKELESKGVQVIISRGGTYQDIKASLNIPTIEIRTTTYDLVEALRNIGDIKDIAIVGYPIIISDFKCIKNLMNTKIDIIEINSKKDITYAIELAKQKGIKNFIGDSTVVEISKKLDCRGILLSSTQESIKIAIDEAYKIFNITNQLNRRNEELIATIDNVRDGIVIMNNNYEVININKKAKKLIGIKNNFLKKTDIKNIIETTKILEVLEQDEPITEDIQEIKGKKIFMNRIPMYIKNKLIGAIVILKPISEVLENEIYIRKKLNKNGFIAKYKFEEIVYKSEIMKICIEQAKVFSTNNAPVHIYGETGVGKELIAQSIHNESLRKNRPFVAVNCSALPSSLIESELFGYEEGAFTGAKKNGKMGVFELAHKGTLFLDEITEMPLDLQGRLLRVLQESEVIRVGGEEVINVDVRLITATNKNLLNLVEKGKFREDLYYRIYVLPLRIPPLRDRRDDIVLLSNYFLEKYADKYNLNKLSLNDEIKEKLMNYIFKGNVRELENFMEISTLLENFIEITKIMERNDLGLSSNSKIKTLKELELDYIDRIYRENKKNLDLTSKILGISRTTLWRKIKEIKEINVSV